MTKKVEYLNLPKSKDGKPYISYSQHSSFNETSEEFYYQMILQYIFGIKMESRFQLFATYGGHCGEYIETKGKTRGDLLSDADCVILDKLMKDFPATSEYEREVWIDRGNYFILGFEDRWTPTVEGACQVEDFKTGSIEKKSAHYASENYGQTTLYCYAEVRKGLAISDSFVTLLDRKGNPMSDTNPTRLYLSGEIKTIPTPYSAERAKKVLASMDDSARRIASLKTTHDKLKELSITL
tara:strand:+ start:16446 stop:17162 length:717 start_codon:yes stop_codon:yes gene_type:complete